SFLSQQFDGTRDILVEPELLRRCSTGTGPEYRWRIWNEDGKEVLISSSQPILNSPTLLLHPIYDLSFWKIHEGGQDANISSEFLPESVLQDGVYTAQLTIKERDTIVEASFNTTFGLVAIRLKVVFIDGTEREVDGQTNITLRVEVTTPTPNYTLKWDCQPVGHPDHSCFSHPDPWDSFTASTRVVDGFFSHLYHMWDNLHNRTSHYPTTTTGAPSGVNTTSYHLKEDVDGSSTPSGHTIPSFSTSQKGPAYSIWSHPHITPSGVTPPSFSSSQEGVRLSQLDKKFVETISIPVSSLRAPTERFLFKVSCHHHRMTIGIRSHIRSAFPYGAARRMVFESECMSCTPEELKVLQYSWRLSLVYKVGSLGETTRSLTTANTDETELTLTRALRRHQTEKGFLLRPRDYLRVYNKTILRTTLPQVDEHGDSGGSSSLSYTEYLGAIDPEELVGLQHFSPRDLQKLPRPLTPDLVDRAREVERRWRGKSPYTGDGLRGTQPEGRQKRGVRQDVWTPPSSPEKKVSRSPPLPGVKLTGSGSRQVQEGGGGGGGQQKNHAGGRASPRTRQRRDAQNRQMKEEDRPSSAQTNKRREVVGRHSGAGDRGAAAMTDDAAPQEHSPVTSAKVTLHHHRLLHHAPYHNILSGQYGAGESEGGGLWHTRVGEGDGSVVSLPDPSWRQVEETAETVSQLEREDVRRVQQVDAGYLPPRHNDARGENPGNSGRNLQPREEIFTGRHKVDDKEARRAYTDREERARSQSNEWEAKVPQDFMEFRSDEIILLRGKEDEGDLERMKQHKEEEEKDTRLLREDPAGGLELWQINEGDHGGRDYQLGGGSKGRKKWRQMSVSGAGNDEAQDAARVTTEDPDDDKNLANTLTNSQVTERGVSGANKKSREDLRRTGVMEEVRVEEVTPLSTSSSTGNFLVDIAGGERQVLQLDAKTEKTLGVTEDELAAGDNDKVVNTLMLHDTSPNAPVNDRKIRSVGGEERSTLTPRHLHPHTGVPHSSSPPPAASPSQPTPPPFPSLETSSSITPSLQVDKEEEGQFSSTIDDHSGREDEWSGTAALHQSRREAVEAEENGEAVLVKEDKAVLTTEEEREREDKERTTGFEEEETVKGGAEKRRKNKKNKYKKLEERDKGQQIVNSEEGERTLSHQQEETGYKENGLTSEGIVKVRETEENDGVEGENDIGGVAEAGRLPHTTRHPTHHRHDSTHLPIRVAHSGLVPDGGTPITQSDQFLPDVASGVPWDTVASGAREGRPSSHTTRNTKVRGLRPVHYVPGGARSPHRALPSPPELGPVSVDASLNVLPGGPNTQPQGTRGPHPPYAAPLQAAAQFFHPPYVSLTHSPSGVLDYTEFKKLNAAKPTHHKILPQGTSESGRSIGNTRGKADVDRVKLTPPGEELSRGGGGTPSTHTTADGVGGSRYGVLGEREDGPPLRQRNRGRVSGAGTAQQQNRRPQQQTVGETERSGASGRGQGYGGVEVRTPPPANTRPRPPHILLPTEGQSSPVRGVDYGKKIKEF
ncbi:putative PKD/REJ-like domain-containing protein, partial [Homarus americanus]